jgi:hypothetical protein
MVKIIEKYYNKELLFLNRLNVNVEICMVEWVFSLFSSLIPLETQLLFYEGFFADGWQFFYKVCVSIFESIDMLNSNYNDAEDVYIALKLGKHEDINRDELIKRWRKILFRAFNIEFAESK